MNGEGYFVVTSGVQNPALFSSNFTTPVKLDQNFEIGLQSITHGPLFNITVANNKIVIIRTVPGGAEDINFILLDPGLYTTVSQLLKHIYEKLKELFDKHRDNLYWGKEPLKYTLEQTGKITIRLPTRASFEIDNVKEPGENPLFNILHLPSGRYKKLSEYDSDILRLDHLTFIYSSIVEESYINNRKSRLLAMTPLKSMYGYNHTTFQNISYYPLAVNTFNDIIFSLKDTYGMQTQLTDTSYPTILKIHIRKRL